MPKRMSTAEANRRGAEAERWHYRHNLRGYSRVGNPVDHTYIWKTTTTDTIEQVLRYYAAQTGLPNLAQLDDAGTTNFDSTVPGRPAVVFDVLARLLRHTYGENSLVYARNITDIEDKIMAAAEEHNADVIAMSSHGRTGFRRFVMGSVAERVLNEAPVPVLMVGPEERDED